MRVTEENIVYSKNSNREVFLGQYASHIPIKIKKNKEKLGVERWLSGMRWGVGEKWIGGNRYKLPVIR